MRWELDWGPHREALESVAAAGRRVEALENRPELYDDLVDVWRAFLDLSRARAQGFGPSGIAIADVATWLDLHRITDPDEREEFADLIAAMDAVYLEFANKKHADAAQSHARHQRPSGTARGR